jgi:tetratricopeptide (TPR) repeat protein
MARPIFLSGRVMMDDGTPPPDAVVIERVCSGVVRPEAYTDSKGRFSFQLGQNTAMLADASVGSASDPLDWGNQPSGASGRSGRTVTERDLMACELRASLPGFRSDVVSLAGRRIMDNPDIGVIVLRRLGHVEGTTISMTSLQAPKDAKKAYDKGLEAVRKKKFEEAQTQFEKAVQGHPRYAAAWFELGMIFERLKNPGQARKAYGEALRADSKYVKPYLQLAMLAVQERQWQEAAETTARILKLNPVDFPSAYFYHSVANFNLRNLEAAEKSARAALKLDTQHRVPKLEHLLGVILANQQDYAGAAEHMKSYIERAPDASDVDVVRKQLVEIEKLLAGRAAGQPPQP